MKKSLCFLCSVFLIGGMSLHAEEIKSVSSECIPIEMMPNSKIEYVSKTDFVIIEGGVAAKRTCSIIQGIPDPERGMTITYASDGKLLDIKLENGNDPDYAALLNINEIGIMSEVPMRANPRPILVSSWGNNNNVYVTNLYDVNGNLYRVWNGEGRATNFTDEMGNAGYKNRVGSVATKQYVDEPPYNTKISVNAPNNGGGRSTQDMYKTDVGGLPDAVIDIWYTGVTKWGYTWNEYLSINDITYIHY